MTHTCLNHGVKMFTVMLKQICQKNLRIKSRILDLKIGCHFCMIGSNKRDLLHHLDESFTSAAKVSGIMFTIPRLYY